MKTEIRLTQFKGKSIKSYNSFLSVDTDGTVSLKLSKIRLRDWRKAFQLKKDAITFYKRFTYENPFEEFCKKYKIDWRVSFELTAGKGNIFTIYCDYPYTLTQLQEKVRAYCAIPADKFHLCEDLRYYAKLLDEKILENKVRNAGIYVGQNAVVLTNGKYLVSKYSGARRLRFVVLPSLAEFLPFSDNKELEKNINVLWENSPEFMYGNYKISKKGAPLFYPCAKSNAKHILVKMETAMKDPYGGNYPINNNIYHEFNAPYIFNIIENGIKLKYDEEDI